jgi:hypothetical protein
MMGLAMTARAVHGEQASTAPAPGQVSDSAKDRRVCLGKSGGLSKVEGVLGFVNIGSIDVEQR